MAACHDREPVGPSALADLRPLDGRRASELLPGDSPDFVEATTPHLASNGDGHSRRLGEYPNPTMVIARAYGRVTWVQDWGSSGWYGPAGWKSGAGAIYGNAYLRGTINR